MWRRRSWCRTSKSKTETNERRQYRVRALLGEKKIAGIAMRGAWLSLVSTKHVMHLDHGMLSDTFRLCDALHVKA